MGAEAVRKLLMELDLVKLSQELRTDLSQTSSKQKKKELINRLKIVEVSRGTNCRKSRSTFPVLPKRRGRTIGSMIANDRQLGREGRVVWGRMRPRTGEIKHTLATARIEYRIRKRKKPKSHKCFSLMAL